MACMYCTLQTLSCWDSCPAGISNSNPVQQLSFLQIWLDKGRRYKRKACIVLERSELRCKHSMERFSVT